MTAADSRLPFRGMSGRQPSILIIGGGIFGITAAVELRDRGWAVTVLDQGRIPHPDAASTDISKVVRMDYGTDEIYTAMGERSLARWAEWNAASQQELFHNDGFLVMSRDEEMRPGGFEHDTFHFLAARGHRLRRVRRSDLAANHPVWNSEKYGDGYLNPAGGWAESGKVVAWQKAAAAAHGVIIVESARFHSLIEKAGTVAGACSSDGREWLADATLMAAGAWTPFLLPELQTAMRTTGQPVVHFMPANPGAYRPPAFPVWGADIGRTGWYGFPANADGIVKVANHGPGRPITDPSQARDVSADEIAKFRGFLRDTFPPLADAPVAGTRQCWYCDTFDGHFWIDHNPHRPGLVVAAGDSGHAFKFAPVIGDLIADVVERKPNPWKQRFRWREPADEGGEGARAR